VPAAEAITRNRGPRPLSPQSLVDLVINEIRRSIMDGSLPPGSTILVSEMASRLEVSHIPVREALRRLEAGGLVNLRRSRNAIVAPMSRQDAESIFRAELILEGELSAHAVPAYTDADRADIQAAYDALEVTPDGPLGTDTLSARHAAFHRALVDPVASPWDHRLLDILSGAAERYMFLITGGLKSEGPMTFRDDHAGLLAAAFGEPGHAPREELAAHLAHGMELIGPALDRLASAS
jgi:DNA-binding GntR family transcriptional regulator